MDLIRLIFPVLAVLLILSCGRPLSQGEQDFVHTLTGEQLETRKVRLVKGALVGKFTAKRKKRPRLTCRENIWPEPTNDTVTISTAGVVLFNTLFLAKPYYSEDYLRGYPNRMNLVAAMLLAHEMTHVWQWQQRSRTNYHPLKAASEHKPGIDPYLLDILTKARFLDYPFEQQGVIAEEYVCCRALDPGGNRTKRLHALLAQEMPVAPLNGPQSRPDILIPWKNAKIKGICS